MHLNFLQSNKNASSEFIDQQLKWAMNPNQFCLSIFQRGSYEELNIDEFQPQNLSLSQFFQNPSQKLATIEEFTKKKKRMPAIKQDAAIRDYKKNICRNILRHAIKSLYNQNSMHFLKMQFAEEFDEQALLTFQKFYQQNVEIITGFRVLKDHLIIKDGDSLEIRTRKTIFKRYLIWFLQTQATLCILQSDANNVAEYLRYKNEVLLYYVQQPTLWYSNKPLWKQQ